MSSWQMTHNRININSLSLITRKKSFTNTSQIMSGQRVSLITPGPKFGFSLIDLQLQEYKDKDVYDFFLKASRSGTSKEDQGHSSSSSILLKVAYGQLSTKKYLCWYSFIYNPPDFQSLPLLAPKVLLEDR